MKRNQFKIFAHVYQAQFLPVHLLHLSEAFVDPSINLGTNGDNQGTVEGTG